jgi:uncharacterized DUF497 family protein
MCDESQTLRFITELHWRDDRVDHIARHEVAVVEIEEAIFEDRRGRIKRIGPAKRDPRQTVYEFYGRAGSGRYLFIVLIHLGKGVGLPVTARDMTKEERRYYG